MAIRGPLVTILLALLASPVFGGDTGRTPEQLTLTIARVADGGQPVRHLFVLNGVVAYQTIDGLKGHLKGLPKGSTLTWAPGCVSFGGEPLGSEKEVRDFRRFCEAQGIKFVVIPAG